MPTPDAIGAWPAPVRDPILGCARGDLPPNVALMQLAISVESADALGSLLSHASEIFEAAGQRHEAGRLRNAFALWSDSPDAWPAIRAVLAQLDGAMPSLRATNAVANWTSIFDRLSRLAPEAGVALYALGRADLLNAATGEVVDRMRGWGMLGGDRILLDIGCGIGRFLPALSRETRMVVGLDIAHGMLVAASKRCAGSNVALVQGSGRDLAAFRDCAFHAVYAIDSFPYIVDAGSDVAAAYFADVQRVLRPCGDFLIVNYSYRGRLDTDRAEVERLAAANGFAVMENGSSGFRHWDGRIFRLAKLAAVDLPTES